MLGHGKKAVCLDTDRRSETLYNRVNEGVIKRAYLCH